MIDPTLFLLYCITSYVNIATPGIAVVFLVGISLQYGFKKAVLPCIGLGVSLLVISGLALSGLGVLLANSPFLFLALKLSGAAVLFYLGIKKWFTQPNIVRFDDRKTQEEPSSFSLAIKMFCLQFANPQFTIFVISVTPQFISLDLPYTPQCVLMTLFYAVTATLSAMGYSFLASRARLFLVSGSGPRLISRVVSVIFICMAAYVCMMSVRSFLN